MYKITIPERQLSDLWKLREYASKGPISRQIIKAITDYLQKESEEIGCSITDMTEAIVQHEQEKEKKHEEN